MKKLLSAALLFVFLFAFSVIADLTGTWKGTVNANGTPLDLTYQLKADGDKLTGTVLSSYGDFEVIDGKISGNDFSYKLDIGGLQELKGKYYGDSIVITSDVRGTEVKDTFKRVK